MVRAAVPGTVPAAQPTAPPAVSRVDDTSPYGWPYDGRFNPARLALVLCGWSAGWRDAVTAPSGLDDTIAALVATVADTGGACVAVAPGTPDPRRGPGPGAPLALDAGPVLVAAGVDGFFDSGLDPWLRRQGRDQLILAGYGLEGPVHSTMRSANDRGYECLLVVDACAAGLPELAAASASSVEMSGGIFGAVGAVTPVLTALRSPQLPTPNGGT